MSLSEYFQKIIDIFPPNFLLFVSFTFTILINIYIIIKTKNIWVVIIFNIILSLTANFIGLENYDLLTLIIKYLIEIIKEIFIGIWDTIISFFDTLIKKFGDMIKSIF